MASRKPDTYLNLCTEVYDISKQKPPENDYAFYRSYVKKAKGLVLEPMCGTGRFLLPLVEEGFEVHGFDASKHMLKSLYAKAKLKKLKPNVWQGHVEDLDTQERYNMIFLPISSFCLILDQPTVKSVLKKLYTHLNDKGILLFEAETPKAIPDNLGVWKADRLHRSDGKVILISYLDLAVANIRSRICRYELIEGNKVIRTEIEEYKMRLYLKEEMVALIKDAGFSKVKAMAASKLIQDKGAVIYECTK
jgi:SAM-dependent methyltransferase